MTKKLSNPPVYYTIVQAQFNPITAMGNYINEIQDKLRLEGYTLFDPIKMTQLHFDTSLTSVSAKPEVVEIPVWRITKSDRKSGFILSQSHLVYHTTHYQTHEQFFNAFLRGLEIIHSIVQLEHLSRLGLRYLNAVLPIAGEDVNQYLVDGLHGLNMKAPLRYSLYESVFNTKIEPSSTLVNRVYNRTGPLGFPPDMTPHDLYIMPKFAKGDDVPHAVIDIDHFIEGQMALNPGQIKTQLTSLHAGIKQAFSANITKHANKVWD